LTKEVKLLYLGKSFGFFNFKLKEEKKPEKIFDLWLKEKDFEIVKPSQLFK